MAKKIALTFELAVTGQTKEGLKQLEQRLLKVNQALTQAKRQGKEDLYGDLTNQQKALRNQLKKTNAEARKQIKQFEQAKFPKSSIIGMRLEYSKLRQEIDKLSAAERKAAKGKEIIRKAQQLRQELNRTSKAVGDFRYNIGQYGTAFQGFGRSLLTAVGYTGAVFAVVDVLRNAKDVVVEFDQANANLASILGKTRGEITDLTENALRLGATTAFTATEVLNLQTELAKLGFSNEDIINATLDIENFAIAVGADVPEAAALAGAALRAFGISTEDTERVVSTLGVATTKSALDFQKINVALSIVAPIAAAANVSIERTTALLGVLANRGFEASIAGTSLRNILLELSTRGLTWNEAMNKINSATNKSAVALELFGKRGAAAALVLAENGVEADQLEQAITGANGALQEMADERLDTVSGKAKLLNSAWQGLVLSIEDGDNALATFFKTAISGLTNFTSRLTQTIEGDRGILEFIASLSGGVAGAVIDTAVAVRINQSGEDGRILGSVFDSIKDIETANQVVTQFQDEVKLLGEELNNLNETEGNENKIAQLLVAQTQALDGLAGAELRLKELRESATDVEVQDLLNGAKTLDQLKERKSQLEQLISDARLNGEATGEMEREYSRLVSEIQRATAWLDRFKKSAGDTKNIEKAAANIRKLRSQLIENSFDQQISSARSGAQNSIASLVGTPEQIEEQTALINQFLDKQIADIEGKRTGAQEEAIKDAEDLNNEIVKLFTETEVSSLQFAANSITSATAVKVQARELEYKQELSDLEQQLIARQIKQKEFDEKAKDLEIQFKDDVAAIRKASAEDQIRAQQDLLQSQIRAEEAALQTRLQAIADERKNAVESARSNEALTPDQVEDVVSNQEQLAIAQTEAAKIESENKIQKLKVDNAKVIAGIQSENVTSLTEKEKQSIDEVAQKRLAQAELEKQIRTGLLSLFDQITNDLVAGEKRRVEDRYDTERDNLKSVYDLRIQQAEGDKAEQERLATELAEKRKEIDKREAKARQEIALTEAIIQGALGVLKSLGNPVQVAFAIAATAANIATIKAQKFATGGKIKPYENVNGRIAKTPNIQVGDKDNVLIRAHNGETVVNPYQEALIKYESGDPDIFAKAGVPGHKKGGKVVSLFARQAHRFVKGGLIGDNIPQVVNPNPIIKEEVRNQIMKAEISEASMNAFAAKTASAILQGLENQEKEKSRKNKLAG